MSLAVGPVVAQLPQSYTRGLSDMADFFELRSGNLHTERNTKYWCISHDDQLLYEPMIAIFSHIAQVGS